MSDVYNVLKEQMGYTLENNRCATCVHHKEKDHPMIDRMWVSECDIAAPVVILTVDPSGTCKHWADEKDRKDGFVNDKHKA